MALTLALKALVAAETFTGFEQTLPVRKRRTWPTEIVAYDNRTEQRNQILTRPIREWNINWNVLEEAARDKLQEVFDAARGSYDSFLWLDDDEFQATSVSITTDGTTATYQLKEDYFSGETYTWSEDKKDIVAGDISAPVVTHSVDGAQTETEDDPPTVANEFNLDDTTGIMTWAAASPPSAGTLTCTFQYYFRVRFADETLEDLKLHATPLYSNQNVHIVEVLPTT